MRILGFVVGAAAAGSLMGLAAAYVEIGAYQPVDVAAVGVVPATGQSGKMPRVEIDNSDYDFGRMQRGTTKSHDFQISNAGDAPLRLEVGTPSCKCTVGELEKNILEPGESVAVHVEWKASAGEGPFRQTVPIGTNDPLQSQLQLTVHGQVTATTGLVPSVFSFHRIPVGESRQAEVILMAFLEEDFEVSKAEILAPDAREHFDVVLESVPTEELPNPNATAGVRLKVTAKDSLPIGRFVQWLALETNLPDAEELEIPVEGRVAGDVFIRGRGWSEEQGTLKLGQVLRDEGKKSDVNVIVRGPAAENIEIEVERVDPPELEVTLGAPKRYKDELFHIPLTVEIPRGTRPMVRLNPDIHEPASITLRTNHPQAPTLTLGVRFSVQ